MKLNCSLQDETQEKDAKPREVEESRGGLSRDATEVTQGQAEEQVDAGRPDEASPGSGVEPLGSGHSESGHKAGGLVGDSGDRSDDGRASEAEVHVHDYLSPKELFSHVQDSTDFHFSPTIVRLVTGNSEHDGHFSLPQVGFITGGLQFEGAAGTYVKPLDLKLTRFMVVELMSAVMVLAVFALVARKLSSGAAPKGRFWNLFEAMVQFVRRDIGQAVIGKKDGAKFAPFLLTIFFFILGCNLLGMVPGLGAPTGDFVVTATLALIVFFVVVKAGIDKFGVGGFFKNLVPSMDLPPALRLVLVPMIFVIEVIGFLIKHFVLAVRLFANMMAGHLVLAAILAFIGATHGYWHHYLALPASVLGATALSILEVFVAFLQAYIFTFLTALFISSATHHH